MTHLNEDDLALHYYGEMDAGEEAHAGAHLADCARCRASYATLQRILAAVDADVVPEPREGFERTVWARLQPALDSRGWWASGRTGTRPWFAWLPMQVGWGAAVAVLVIGAFFAGRGWQRDSVPGGAAAGAAMRERVLLVDLGEHLDRSQAMLVELVSAGGSGAVDISSERARAEQLVESNRLYRQAAEANGDRAFTALLDELERVLVDVAASPAELSSADMADVRQRIDDAGLLFKLRVVSAEVRTNGRSGHFARGLARARSGNPALVSTGPEGPSKRTGIAS